MIPKQIKYAAIIIALLAIAGLVFHFWNPLKGLISQETHYRPGEDPKIHEMYLVDSMNTVFNKFKDSVSNKEIQRLQAEIDFYKSDRAQSEQQVISLGRKKTANDVAIDNLKPGTEKEDAVNKEWNKRHGK